MLKLFSKLTLQHKIKKDIAYMQHLAKQDKCQPKLKDEHYKKLSVINSLNQYLELIKKS